MFDDRIPFQNSISPIAIITTLGLAGISALGPTPAAAQNQARAAEAEGVIEEIVVTARKRSETLQDVPISINAQTEAALRNKGATNLEDISANVAGFTVQNLGPGQSQVAIRGVSAGQIVRDQPGVKEQVGIYLDESVISLSLFTPDLDLFDVGRVEVLRGPQGTLFGSGSLSGTVRYITNKPNPDAIELIAEASGVVTDGGGEGGDFKAAINVPIVEGKAAIRAVGYYNFVPGFIDAVQPDLSINKDVNDSERYGGRIAIEFRPTDSLTITPRVIYQEIDNDGFNRIDAFNILANPFTTTRPAVALGDRRQFTQFEESFTDEFLLVDGTIDWDVGPVTLTAITSYTDRDVLQIRDATQLTGAITFGILGIDDEDIFTIDAPLFDATTVEMFTQEARISSNTPGPFEWVLGVFYSDIERVYSQNLPVDGFEAATGISTACDPVAVPGCIAETDELFKSLIPYDFEQIAIFGEASYDITDRLTASVGLRWFDFEETRTLNFDGIFADQTIGLPGKTTSDGVSPRIIVSYDASDNVTFNAQVAKGFRLGGINDPLNRPLCSPQDLDTFGGFDTFDDEELWNYEIGAKTSFDNGRGTLNIAAFWADINDLQATLTAGTCSSRIVFNVPKARSVGAEAELAYQMDENFSFSATASLIDAELRSTVTSTDEQGNTSVVAGIEKGNRLPTVPKFQAAATATYVEPLENDMEAFISATVQHVGSRFTQVGDQADGFGTIDLFALGDPSVSTFTFDPKLPSYQLGNIRLGVRTDRWEIAGYINNIWDERAFLALDQELGSIARVGYLTNPPRTFGINLRGQF